MNKKPPGDDGKSQQGPDEWGSRTHIVPLDSIHVG